MNAKRPLKGVNLGGWLVAEKWMTPSLFAGTKASNEYELSQTETGRSVLRRHHDTFIVESDIAWLKEQGIEVVRVPVGHWVFGDAEPYIGAIERLDWLVETTAKYNIKVLLDLHGAPGAQNDHDHSGSGAGRRGNRWLKDRKAQEKTIEVLVRIAEHYRDAKNVWGLQLLNEPSYGLTGWRLARFYRRAYRRLTQVTRPGTYLVFSDAYAPLFLTNTFGLLKHRSFPVAMDSHFYHCFGKANKSRTFQQHLQKTRRTKRLIRLLSFSQPVIVGEWSSMLPYPVTSENTRRFARAQEDAFRRTLAHFYWNYKTEAPGRWNFRDMSDKLSPPN